MKKGLLVLLMVLMVISLSACTGSEAAEDQVEETKIIIDALGREVTVPTEINRVGNLGVMRLLTYMQAGDMVVGATDMDNQSLIARPYTYANPQYADIPVIAQGGSGGIVPFDEEIIKQDPDVLFVVSDYGQADELSQKTGIPVIAIDSPGLFDGKMEKSINIIGQVLNKEDRAKEINDFMKEAQDDLNNRTSDIEDDQKPAVYNGALNFKGKHGFDGTSAKYGPFDAINANNVADQTGQSGAFMVDLEQVMVWDPDIIFLNPENMDLVNEQYQKNPDYFESLKAVKNKQVYTQLAYNNNYTNIEIALADAYYAGTVIYPQAFKDIDAEKKADEIFEFFLGKPLYADFVSAGQGLGSLSIGK